MKRIYEYHFGKAQSVFAEAPPPTTIGSDGTGLVLLASSFAAQPKQKEMYPEIT